MGYLFKIDIICIWIENPPKDIKKVAIIAAFILERESKLNKLRPFVISKRPFKRTLEYGFKLRYKLMVLVKRAKKTIIPKTDVRVLKVLLIEFFKRFMNGIVFFSSLDWIFFSIL